MAVLALMLGVALSDVAYADASLLRGEVTVRPLHIPQGSQEDILSVPPIRFAITKSVEVPSMRAVRSDAEDHNVADLSIDVTESGVLLRNITAETFDFPSAGFIGYRFVFEDIATKVPLCPSIHPESKWDSFHPWRLRLRHNMVFVNIAGMSIKPGSVLRIELTCDSRVISGLMTGGSVAVAEAARHFDQVRQEVSFEHGFIALGIPDKSPCDESVRG